MRTVSTHSSLRSRRWTANAAATAAMLACSALLIFPPASFSFYPPCPIREYLGLLCPGCGATRALAALLHGNLQEALRQNALFVLLLPLALAFAARTWLRAVRPGEFRWPSIPAPALYATLLVTAVFTIARNFPR